MTRKKKVLLGAGVVAVLVMGGWGAWRVRPFTTTTTYRKGAYLVTEERTRSYYLLSPSEWGFSRGYVTDHPTRLKIRRLGAFAVEEDTDTTRTFLPE